MRAPCTLHLAVAEILAEHLAVAHQPRRRTTPNPPANQSSSEPILQRTNPPANQSSSEPILQRTNPPNSISSMASPTPSIRRHRHRQRGIPDSARTSEVRIFPAISPMSAVSTTSPQYQYQYPPQYQSPLQHQYPQYPQYPLHFPTPTQAPEEAHKQYVSAYLPSRTHGYLDYRPS